MQLDRRISPGTELEPEIMESATDFHNGVAKALLAIADFVFDDTQTLDSADDMLDTNAQGSEPLIGRFFQIRK